MLSLVYSLFALGLAIVCGVMSVYNMAHGELYMWGAAIVLITFAAGYMPYPVAVIVAILGIIAISIVIELGFFRPLRGQPIAGFVMSVGLVYILQVAALATIGFKFKKIAAPFPGVLDLGITSISWQKLIVILTSIALMVLLYIFLSRFRLGRAIRAASQDMEAATLQGINSDRMALLVMALGGALAGAAGALIGPLYVVHPYIGAPMVWKGFIIIIIGGIGSLTGAILASFIVGFLDSFVATYFDARLAPLFAVLMMVIILVIRPRGLLGEREW